MNSQIMTALQTLLMVGGSFAVGSKLGNGTIGVTDIQSLVGGISAIAGIFLNHFAATKAG